MSRVEREYAKLLSGLNRIVKAMEHSSPEALKQYLKDHPNADKSKHTVKSEGSDDSKVKSVESAKADLDKAKQALKDQDISDNEANEYRNIIEGGDFRVSLDGYGSLGDPKITKQVEDLVYRLTNAKSKDSNDFLKSINVSDLEDFNVSKSDAQEVMGLLQGGSLEAPVEALLSGDNFKAYAGKLNNAITAIATVVGDKGDASFKGDTLGLDHLPAEIKALVGGLQKELNSSLKSYHEDMDNITRIKDLRAVKSLVDAEEGVKKAEKAEKAKAEKEKGESKTETPKKEKTPAEIKKDLEEALKNSDMDPEEKQKAIKRMKKMSPADMKAQLSSMGDDEGEEGGKTAFIRKASYLLNELKYQEKEINRVLRQIRSIR